MFFRILDFRDTNIIVQYVEDFQDIPIVYAGKIYEVVVISINGDFETESDPQEVFHKPSKKRL